jgi:hypothetical protein
MTTPRAKNRTPLAAIRLGGLSEPSSKDLVEQVERGLARLGNLGVGVQTQPLRQMRIQVGLDLQIVYFTIRMPIGGGVKLRVPVMTTITPRVYSPTRAQHI